MTKRARAEEAARAAVRMAVEIGTPVDTIIPAEVLSVASVCAAADCGTAVGVRAIQEVARATGWIRPEQGVGVRLLVAKIETDSIDNVRAALNRELEIITTAAARAVALVDSLAQ